MPRSLVIAFWCVFLVQVSCAQKSGVPPPKPSATQHSPGAIKGSPLPSAPESTQPPSDPSMPVCLSEDDEKLKFLGEACKTEKDCYTNIAGSTSCKNGVCVCNEGFLTSTEKGPSGKTRSFCANAPFLNQDCTTTCTRPAVCAVPESPLTKGQKVCVCQPPYMEKNGACYKDCKPDETYDPDTGNCYPKCKSNEVKVENRRCKKLAKLGEECDDKRQCITTFAVCLRGKCACGMGMTANAETCETQKLSCPVGDPVIKNGAVVKCTIQKKTGKPPQSSGRLQDDCSSTQFCYLHGAYGEGASGHCCQIPKLSCPFGEPHPNATCGPAFGPYGMKSGSDEALNSNAPFCPTQSHTCILSSFGGSYDIALCCPLECTIDHVAVNGRCYPKRELDETCDINEQCQSQNGACEKGTCVCPKGTIVQQDGPLKMCIKICKPGEVKYFSECLPGLKLGDTCDPQAAESLCPQNSYCSENTRKCVCSCGYIKLDEGACGPPPTCAGEPPNMTKPVTCTIPGMNMSSVASAVKECPTGQYCAKYMRDAGLCCPKPAKPVCPDGSPPGKAGCDPRQAPTACGEPGKWICYSFLDPAGDQDPKAGSVCCPNT